MTTYRAKGFAAIVLVIIVLVIGLFSINGSKVTIVKITSKSGMSAEIVGFKENLLLDEFGADLIVTSSDGQMLLTTNLLHNRDSLEDIRVEFSSLEFTNEVLYIDGPRQHYGGPNQFRIVNTMQPGT